LRKKKGKKKKERKKKTKIVTWCFVEKRPPQSEKMGFGVHSSSCFGIPAKPTKRLGDTFRGVKWAKRFASKLGLGSHKLGSGSTRILNEALREHKSWLE
jgi:hypothetical protein